MKSKIQNSVRLYRFLEPQHVIPTIAQRKIKISTFDNLNDPHELLGARLDIPGIQDATDYLIDQTKNNMGMLCWCKTYSNPVMWAHYADRHKGAALGFDVTTDQLRAVDYTTEPKIINVELTVQKQLGEFARGESKLTRRLASDVNEYVRQVFSTKSKAWEYEEEWRTFTTIIDQEDGMFFKPYKPGLHLREVILGLRCTRLTVEEVKEAVSGLPKGVKILRAKVQNHSFELTTADAV